MKTPVPTKPPLLVSPSPEYPPTITDALAPDAATLVSPYAGLSSVNVPDVDPRALKLVVGETMCDRRVESYCVSRAIGSRAED